MELRVPHDLGSLLALLQEHGVTHYRSGDLELRLGPVPHSGGEEVPADEGEKKIPKELRDLPDQYKRAFEVVARG